MPGTHDSLTERVDPIGRLDRSVKGKVEDVYTIHVTNADHPVNGRNDVGVSALPVGPQRPRHDQVDIWRHPNVNLAHVFLFSSGSITDDAQHVGAVTKRVLALLSVGVEEILVKHETTCSPVQVEQTPVTRSPFRAASLAGLQLGEEGHTAVNYCYSNTFPGNTGLVKLIGTGGNGWIVSFGKLLFVRAVGRLCRHLYCAVLPDCADGGVTLQGRYGAGVNTGYDAVNDGEGLENASVVLCNEFGRRSAILSLNNDFKRRLGNRSDAQQNNKE